MLFIILVLPLPAGPHNPKNCPWRTLKVTPSAATIPPLYSTLTSRSSIWTFVAFWLIAFRTKYGSIGRRVSRRLGEHEWSPRWLRRAFDGFLEAARRTACKVGIVLARSRRRNLVSQDRLLVGQHYPKYAFDGHLSGIKKTNSSVMSPFNL
jgi:hypothetical protein